MNERKHTWTGATLTLAAVVLLAGPSSAAELRGDATAIALAERMLASLGGRDTWAAARTIRVELDGHYAREAEPWHETYWMDLDVPQGRFELRGPSLDRVIAWTPSGGWEHSDGRTETMTGDRHAFELEYWRHQPVVVFHRLARGVPAIRVEKGDNEHRFDVFDAEGGALVAQFAVDLKHEPIKWGAAIGEREFEHVFGPLTDWVGLRLPAWGASIDGIWRYDHTAVSLSPDPPPVSLEPPAGGDGR